MESSLFRLMDPSGQKIQHRKHFTHFLRSNVGLNTRQLPVLPIAPSFGYEIHETTSYFLLKNSPPQHHRHQL